MYYTQNHGTPRGTNNRPCNVMENGTKIRNSNHVYEDISGILGLRRSHSGGYYDPANSNSDSNLNPNKQTSETKAKSNLSRVSSQNDNLNRVPSQNLILTEQISECNNVKFVCSFGGKILPRPSDGKLRYVGGETRLLSMSKCFTREEFTNRTMKVLDQPHIIKYQLPGEELDALISVSTDEDFQNMMEEFYSGLEKLDGSARLRIFLIPKTKIDFTDHSVCTDYIVAVNKTVEPSPSRTASEDNLSGPLGVLSIPYASQSPLSSPVPPAPFVANHNDAPPLIILDSIDIAINPCNDPFMPLAEISPNFDDIEKTVDDRIENVSAPIDFFVEDVTHEVPSGVSSLNRVVPHVAEGHNTSHGSESEDDDNKGRQIEGSITDATIVELDAGMYGLQIVKNADLEEMRQLGSGTFGTVYHGKWRGTDVAIKRIKKSCFSARPSEEDKLKKDFWREAQILSKLHHPNIMAFYGVVPDGPEGTLATVTELMVNGSLRNVLLKKEKVLNKRKRLMIAMDAACGMEYLHSKNIVHFDLKCDNLLVNMRDPHRPICKVGDFGMSRIKRNTLVSGGLRGTLPWMAPELLNSSGHRITEKVDVFSFGISLWEILTGEEPYAGMHFGAIIGGIFGNTLRPPIPDNCDPEWQKLMEDCWCVDPDARPSFMQITDRFRAMSIAFRSKTQNK